MYEMHVTGTDIWYYFICKRECWLMIHRIAPDEEDDNLEIGRFIHEYRYGRGRKELEADHIKMDRIRKVNGELVVQEIKKSSKFRTSARYQLLYYLYTLNQMGIKARGELSFPEERANEEVRLTPAAIKELEDAIADIRTIARQPVPPSPKKIHFCNKCAYREYCWAEG